MGYLLLMNRADLYAEVKTRYMGPETVQVFHWSLVSEDLSFAASFYCLSFLHTIELFLYGKDSHDHRIVVWMVNLNQIPVQRSFS